MVSLVELEVGTSVAECGMVSLVELEVGTSAAECGVVPLVELEVETSAAECGVVPLVELEVGTLVAECGVVPLVELEVGTSATECSVVPLVELEEIAAALQNPKRVASNANSTTLRKLKRPIFHLLDSFWMRLLLLTLRMPISQLPLLKTEPSRINLSVHRSLILDS